MNHIQVTKTNNPTQVVAATYGSLNHDDRGQAVHIFLDRWD